MEILKALTEDQLRAAIMIGLLTGKTVGGYTPEELEEEFTARTGGGVAHKPEDTPPQRPAVKGIKGAAEYLGCGAKTVERNLARIPHYKLGRAYFFKPEELDVIRDQGGI